MHIQGPLLEDKCMCWHICAWARSGCASAPWQKMSAKKIKYLIGNGPTALISSAETAHNINTASMHLLKKKKKNAVPSSTMCIYVFMYILYIFLYMQV